MRIVCRMTALLPPRDRYIKVSEIAQELRLSPMTVYRLLKSGEIPSVRIGRSFRVQRAAFEAYLERNAGADAGAA